MKQIMAMPEKEIAGYIFRVGEADMGSPRNSASSLALDITSLFVSLKIVKDDFEGKPATTLLIQNKSEYVRKKLL